MSLADGSFFGISPLDLRKKIWYNYIRNLRKDEMKMKNYKIRLNTIDDVRNFVNAVASVECDVDLASGRYVVDAKSIMGIFSLDLANEIDMTVHCDCCIEKVEESLKAYIVG